MRFARDEVKENEKKNTHIKLPIVSPYELQIIDQ
jgi:hypothetical protein